MLERSRAEETVFVDAKSEARKSKKDRLRKVWSD
jgi:hypothetical protein